jgi:hypothetical protein
MAHNKRSLQHIHMRICVPLLHTSLNRRTRYRSYIKRPMDEPAWGLGEGLGPLEVQA